MAVDPQDDARSFSLELDRKVGRGLNLLPGREALENPPDRRRLVCRACRIDGSRDDEPVDRARHCHVVQAQALGALFRLPRLLHSVVCICAAPLARDRIRDAEAETAVRQREDLVGGRRRLVAAGIGHDDDLELETLGGMDREQPDRVGALLLRDRLELPRADRFLVTNEADEAFDVRAAELLVGPSEACELAEVRVATATVPLGKDGEVVVVLGEDPLAETLE